LLPSVTAKADVEVTLDTADTLMPDGEPARINGLLGQVLNQIVLIKYKSKRTGRLVLVAPHDNLEERPWREGVTQFFVAVAEDQAIEYRKPRALLIGMLSGNF
jgi:hypothetical protein